MVNNISFQEYGNPKYGSIVTHTPKAKSTLTLVMSLLYFIKSFNANIHFIPKYSLALIDIQSRSSRITEEAPTLLVFGPASIITVKAYLGFS